MKNILPAICLALLFAACGSSETEKEKGFVIRGKITNFTGKVITLNELSPKGLIFMDTSDVAPDGSFELKGDVTEKTFCTISLPKGAVIIVVDSSADLTLAIDAEDVDHYTVHGSAESEELKKLLAINSTYMEKVRQLETKYQQSGDQVPSVNIQEQIRKAYDSIMANRSREIADFALASNSIVSYFASEFLMPEADFNFLEALDQKLGARFASSKYQQEHHARVEKMRKTAEGQLAPDIVLPDPFGKTITLSSLRGKYVLVDFWASWCRPCREESPRLVQIYNKYKAFGFDIFSVSLDDSREAWTKAINDDRLLWNHVSDLKKWNADVVGLYNIESIPFTILLNKEGKIIARNLRGEELENKVEEAIKQGL